MKAPCSHAFIFCLLYSGLPALVATAETLSCSEDPGCAAPLEDVFLDGDQALSLFQSGAESKRRATGAGPISAQQEASADNINKLLDKQQHATMANTEAPTAPAPVAAEDVGPSKDFDMKKCVAEFVAMTLFVFFGCGSAMGIAKVEGSAWVLQVSLTFGIAITVLAYTIGHYSGGHMNCAVTLGLVLVGNCSVIQGIGNLVAQLLGSVLAALILWVGYTKLPMAAEVAQEEKSLVAEVKGEIRQLEGKQDSLDKTGGLGTNTLGAGVPMASALVCEIVGTFLLMYVVLETAVNKGNDVGNMAPLAIGFAVFLAHSVLIPIDGCSINPTRTTGPAIVNAIVNPKSDGKAINQLWIFWVGPLVGAALAAGVYKGMQA